MIPHRPDSRSPKFRQIPLTAPLKIVQNVQEIQIFIFPPKLGPAPKFVPTSSRLDLDTANIKFHRNPFSLARLIAISIFSVRDPKARHAIFMHSQLMVYSSDFARFGLKLKRKDQLRVENRIQTSVSILDHFMAVLARFS